MAKKIITVSRQFGSGGRTVGKMVAEKLGIAYYDKDIVKQVALETGFDEGFIEDKGEYASSKSWLAYMFSARGTGHSVHSGLSMQDFLWAVQCRIIMQLADKEPCVIVGRCADYILRDRDDCLNVFIHADNEARADRIVRMYGQSEKSPEKRISDKDKRRSTYYRHYTDREWGMAVNYDISLNSSVVGIERCADIIAELAKST